MNIMIPEKPKQIMHLLEDAGFEAYVVGGCVRDVLLNIKPHDWDICTNALPMQTKAVLESTHIHTFDTGIKHGTITALIDGESFEVTTYRQESAYSDGRHPDSVEFVSSIEEDLLRRDFTVNALAYHPQRGLLDIVGGQADLKANILRCVGDAHVRFSEDALRIMRALRFAAIFGFDIDIECKQAIHQDKALLDAITTERIRDEILRLICGDYAEDILLEYADVFGQVIPELKPMFGFDQCNKYHRYDVWEHCVRAMGFCIPDPHIRFALMIHDIGKPSTFFTDDEGCGHFYGHPAAGEPIARKVCKNLHMSKKMIDEIAELVLYHDYEISLSPRSMRRLILKLGTYRMNQLMEIRVCDSLAHSNLEMEENLLYHKQVCDLFEKTVKEMNTFSVRDLAIDGNDVIALGVTAGPRVGEILRALLEMVIDGQVSNERNALLDQVRDLLRSSTKGSLRKND